MTRLEDIQDKLDKLTKSSPNLSLTIEQLRAILQDIVNYLDEKV